MGSSTADQSSIRLLVTGAPDRLSGEADGRVFIKRVHKATGTVPFTLTPGAPVPADQVLVPPSDCASGGVCNFGRTLLAVDVMECLVTDPTTSPPTTAGCGQELLVGAPSAGHGSSEGRVLIYRPITGPGVNGFLSYVGEVPLPAGASLGDEFGFAMAAAGAPPAPAEPYKVAPFHPPWVAISAPATTVGSGSTEDGAVFVYAVVPHSSLPLGAAPVQEVSNAGLGPGSSTGVRAGHALAAGDFDADSIPDLVIGAPEPSAGAQSSGNVFVHFGDLTSSAPSCTGSCKVSPLPYQNNGISVDGHLFADPAYLGLPLTARLEDRFGASLSVGDVVATDSSGGDALVVGAPGHDLGGGAPGSSLDYGAICWFEWDQNAQLIADGCSGAASPTPGDKFGFSVQAGNFILTDARGVRDETNGPLHEVAVASPGPPGSPGRVEILSASRMDGPLTTEILVELDHPDSGTLPGERFGHALGAGYGQDTEFEDLIVGSPLRDPFGLGADGSASLTKSIPVHSCTPAEVGGEWELTDHGGHPVRIRLFRQERSTELMLEFVDAFEMHLFKGFGAGGGGDISGDFCKFNVSSWMGSGALVPADFVIPEHTVLPLGDAWPCGAGSHVFLDVPAEPLIAALAPLAGHPGETIPGEVIDVELNLVSSMDLRLHIDIAKLDFARLKLGPADCRVADTPGTPHPFETVRGVDLCEP